jgi:hypothetical protein
MQMLAHLRDLARQLHDAPEREAVAPLIAQVACAREMCRIAGIPEAVIEDTMSPKTLG